MARGDPPAGVRVVLDARALQEPDRAPTTAAYLDGLLGAFDRSPLAGESFTFLLRSDLADPTGRYAALDVVGRRPLPPTALLRSAALAVDPFVLRSASVGAGWGSGRGGAVGTIFHAVGGGLPLLSRLPVVVTLLDLAPWELPDAYQRTAVARFGQRLRGRLLRDAAAVLVGTDAVAAAARRLLRLRPDRVHVVRLAPRPEFRAGPDSPAAGDDRLHDRPTVDLRAERERLGLPQRYLVYSGRYDARHDLGTLLGALAELSADGRPSALAADVVWPPRVLLVGATPDDRAALARAAARRGVGDALAYAPRLEPARLAALVRGARAALLPAVSEAAGLAAVEALAAGTPVVASAVGALPELVGSAGILVEPGDRRRLAAALATAWTDDRMHGRLRAAATERAAGGPSWDDVARRTREVYAAVVERAGRPRKRPR